MLEDELIKALASIKEMTDPEKEGNYRSDDREGCLDAVFGTAEEALKGVENYKHRVNALRELSELSEKLKLYE